MINFTPFPIIETKNLILRRMNYNDVLDVFDMRKNPEMIEYVDTKLDGTSNDTKAYIDKMNEGVEHNKWIIWAIEHKKLKKVIGSISIWNINEAGDSGELGYGIIPDYQGQGLMSESLLSVIEYGFNIMKLKALDAYTEENNIKSIKLLENCNFTEINRVDDQGYFNKRVYHMIVFRLKNKNKNSY